MRILVFSAFFISAFLFVVASRVRDYELGKHLILVPVSTPVRFEGRKLRVFFGRAIFDQF